MIAHPAFLLLLVTISGVASDGHKDDHCCESKNVGGVEYKLAGEDKSGKYKKVNCLSKCLYKKEGSEMKYCFAAGDLSVECTEEGETTSCCPPNSLGSLGQGNYTPKGEVVTRGDLPIYVVGEGSNTIIWNYGIFGFDSGRTRELCDLLADAGYLVLLPDWFRGEWLDPTTQFMQAPAFLNKHTQWDKIKGDWETLVKPFAEEKGAEGAFGAIGTCWGSYPVIRLSSLPEFKAGISAHPSHSRIALTLGVDEKEMLEKVRCPQLFLPTSNDVDEVKPGGLGQQVLGDKLKIEEFPEMIHGFLHRGNMTEEAVARDVKKAVHLILDFFKMHL